MTGFDLLQNYTPNPKSLLRRVRPRVIPPQISLSAAELVIQAPPASQAMAQKTLSDYSASSVLTLLSAPIYIPQAHGSCSIPPRFINPWIDKELPKVFHLI